MPCVVALPNTRVQRTRSSASPPHSPLTRRPLAGRRLSFTVVALSAGLALVLAGAAACRSSLASDQARADALSCRGWTTIRQGSMTLSSIQGRAVMESTPTEGLAGVQVVLVDDLNSRRTYIAVTDPVGNFQMRG